MFLNISLSVQDAIEGHLNKLRGNRSTPTIPTDQPTGHFTATLGGGVGGAVVLCLLIAGGVEWLRRAGLLQPLVDWVRTALTTSTNRLQRQGASTPPPPPPMREMVNMTDAERMRRRQELARRVQSPHLYSRPSNCIYV